jgi:kumamolisin
VNDGRVRRTVPDLAANAAPGTGYRVAVGGRWYVIGGTSAVAPLVSGMVALIDAEMGRRHPDARIGDFNSILYSRLAAGGALHDVADGSTNGGHYVARPGYDAVTGWGSPNYSRMVGLCMEPREARSPELSLAR